MFDVLIGVDPGVATGLAVWSTRTDEWLLVETCDFHRLLAWVDGDSTVFNYLPPRNLADEPVFVVETAKALAIYRQKYGEKAARAAQAQARNIGENNRESELLIGELRRRGFVVVEYVPRSTPRNPIRKWTQAECKELTGYARRTNQHERDAMRFVWTHRHLRQARNLTEAFG